jgi:hypothetical protein
VTRHNHRELRYEIQVEGHLDSIWLDWFRIQTLTQAADGTSTLIGTLTDQAALYGLLDKLRDLGLPLVSVNRVQAERDLESRK